MLCKVEAGQTCPFTFVHLRVQQYATNCNSVCNFVQHSVCTQDSGRVCVQDSGVVILPSSSSATSGVVRLLSSKYW